MFHHHSQLNDFYRPRLHVRVSWTWCGRTHYISLGEPKIRPPFPGGPQ